MLGDKLLALLAEQGEHPPDYQRLAAEVLGIRGASPALARKLVEQALLVTDWRARWRNVGQIAIQGAPQAPGVYIFRDESARALYVGKAANLRRRLCAHFADRKWRSLPPALARVATVEYERLGSELEALLREAALIRDLQPVVNVQTAAPSLQTRAIAQSLVQDVVLLLPSIDPEAAEMVAARTDGATMLQRVNRMGAESEIFADELWAFFGQTLRTTEEASAPLVFSWLAGRGHRSTRINPHDCLSADGLRIRLTQLLADKDLFVERVVTL